MGMGKESRIPSEASRGRSAREREVLQLLKDYRAFHTAFGGAIPPEDSYITSASYHSPAYIEAGQYWPEDVRGLAVDTYSLLEHALTMLYNSGAVGRQCYLLFLGPYLGDPADPSIVEEWRKFRPNLAHYHDLGIEMLAGYLLGKDLFVIFPSRMTSRQEHEIERRNAELFGVYRGLRAEGRRKTEAVETAAQMCGYSTSRAWAIVRIREQ